MKIWMEWVDQEAGKLSDECVTVRGTETEL